MMTAGEPSEGNSVNKLNTTVEPRFNEVAGDRPNLFVKSRVRYIENLDITNLRGNDRNVRYIEVIVKGAGSSLEHAHSGCESWVFRGPREIQLSAIVCRDSLTWSNSCNTGDFCHAIQRNFCHPEVPRFEMQFIKRWLSVAFIIHLFLKYGGQMLLEMTGERRNKGIGIEIPVTYSIYHKKPRN